MKLRKLGRSLRLVAALPSFLSASAIGAALAVPLVLGASVVACADENDPKTWVDRLKDPGQRTAAIDKLMGTYQQALNKAQGNRDDPAVKSLLDLIVEPLTNAYIELYSPDDSNGVGAKLLEKLQDMRDVRTIPALVKAMQGYEQSGKDDQASIAILGAEVLAKAGKLTDAKIPDALWTIFENYKFAVRKGNRFAQDLNKVIREVAKDTKDFNPYSDKALAKISVEIKVTGADSSPADPNEFLNQMYWQTTAAQVIGDAKPTPDPAAAKKAKALTMAMIAPWR